jgi:sugar phosphate isomerase/epimerase
MKIGMITDSLPGTDVDTLVRTAARLELDMLEFGCGNWSSAPHLHLERMLDSDAERSNFISRLDAHGIAISALNCSGNPLHPGEHGRRHDAVTRKTIKLASLMGVDRVVMMSGCPGAPGDASANWITTEWPPEVREILRWQWDEVLIPYWRDLVAYANGLGVHKLCLELHVTPERLQRANAAQNCVTRRTSGRRQPRSQSLDVDGRGCDCGGARAR